MEKKVLVLAVSEPWFSMIVKGDKDEEYREVKPYWVSRFYHAYLGQKRYFYTHVLFINGYGKNRPRVEKEIVSISVGKPKKGLCPAEWINKEFFIIKFK